MKLKVLVILLLVAAGGAAVFVSLGGLPNSSNAASSDYITTAATTGDVTDEVAATGTIASTASYALGFGAAPVLAADSTTQAGSGTWTVTEVDAEVGKAVKKGDILAKASTADLAEQLKVAETSLSAARLQQDLAKAQYDNASGTTAINQAHAGYLSAVNGRRQAQKSVTDLKAQIALATLKAPIDGVVTAVNVVKGLDSTGTAVTLASNVYQVTADVVESDISSMSIGQPATITVSAIDATIDGKVSSIAPAASSSSGSGAVVTYPVTVTLTGAPTSLRAGMTADIAIVTASANNVLTVPAAALRGTSGDYRVQVLGADGSATVTPVTVGLVTNTVAEIKTGLAEGDVVITGTRSALQSTSSSNGGFGGGGTIAIPGTTRGGGTRFTQP